MHNTPLGADLGLSGFLRSPHLVINPMSNHWSCYERNSNACSLQYDVCNLSASVVTDRARSGHRPQFSGRPIRARYMHVNTIRDHVYDNSPSESKSSCFI